MRIALMIAVAYLLGSIPTALIAGRLLKGIDIRTLGSGNAGATNTGRILGFRAGIAVALIDLAKGLAAVILVSRIAALPGSWGPVSCAIAAVIGHIFPVFAGFRGGKGVATAGGAGIALFPILSPICLACFFIVLVLSRRVVVASLSAALSLPVLYIVSCQLGTAFDESRLTFAIAVFIIIVLTHRANISRLIRGEEKKIDFRAMVKRGKEKP
jgi:acyl phosphate:glycerol-3-phosphate acyltransferase